MGKKVISGAAKRKKKKEREKAAEEAVAEMERLKLGPTKLWTGLVLHHKDVFAAHVIPKLNTTDRWFFSEVNIESRGVLAYAGVNVSILVFAVHECSSISTLEWMWNNMPWGEKDRDGDVIDQAWFCMQVAATNRLELLKWAREVKHCEWDEWTINKAADKGNLEILKYCYDNDCPCDDFACVASCKQAVYGGNLDCVRFLFDKVKPSRETEGKAAEQAVGLGHTDIMKYFVEERKVSDAAKIECVATAASVGNLEMLKYCISNDFPCDEEESCKRAVLEGHLDCLRFLFDKVNPSRETVAKAAGEAACRGHVDILKYFVEERKIFDALKIACVTISARFGELDCIKYLVEEAKVKVPLNDWRHIASARYKEHHECLNYLREKECPEPTDEEYDWFLKHEVVEDAR